MWIVIIIIILACYVYGMYNLFNHLNNKSDKHFVELDTYFQKRINLLPTLVNIFKQYNLEKDTIDRILFLTKDDYSKQTTKEKIITNIELNKLIDRLWEIADSNIILKQNPVFLNVIKQFNLVEEEIIVSKKYHNETVKKYNRAVNIFPNNLLSKILKFYPKQIYDVDEQTRKVIKTELPKRQAVILEEKKEENYF